MSTRSLFGMETELAVADVETTVETTRTPHSISADLLGMASELPSLASSQSGLFLANGARIYLDIGGHLEYSTPEVTSPDAMVAHLFAQEKLLLGLAKRLDYQVRIWKTNVCYFKTGNTWGSHESHLYSGRLNPEDLIPHLVTRVIYTGAGGLDVSQDTPAFSLSPRAEFFKSKMTDDTTEHRGIFNSRNEALARAGYRRLHIIFGDTLCSHKAVWLRIAMTNLITLLSSRGVSVAKDIAIRHPVGTLARLCRDVSCQAVPIELTNGRKTTAVGIQRAYLERIRSCLKSGFMPVWAEEACNRLESLLDDLGKGPEHVAGQLDWAMKYSLFSRYLEKHHAACFDKHSPGLRHVSQLDKDERLRVRAKLAEMDIRFGELGENGIFNQMHASGVLAHEVVPESAIQSAVDNPPQDTRANPRGKWIKRIWDGKDASQFLCDWDVIVDTKSRCRLDLASPFVRTPQWGQIT